MFAKILIICSILFVGFMAYTAGYNWAEWRAVQHRQYLQSLANQQDCELITDFEGLVIYSTKDGVIVRDRNDAP